MMGAKMLDESGPGERSEHSRRVQFWRTLGALGAAGAVTGFVGATTMFDDLLTTLKSMPLLVFAVLGALVISFVAGSWAFFRQVDEVELADNLWGSMLGYYAYAVLLPTWWALWKLDMASEPNDWVILVASLLVGLVVYAARKVQRR